MNRKKLPLIIGAILTVGIMGFSRIAPADSFTHWGRWNADTRDSGAVSGTQVAEAASDGRSVQRGQGKSEKQADTRNEQTPAGQSNETGRDDAREGAWEREKGERHDGDVQTARAEVRGQSNITVNDADFYWTPMEDGASGEAVHAALADTGMNETGADPFSTEIMGTSVLEETAQNETITELANSGPTGWVAYVSTYDDCGYGFCSNALVEKSANMVMEEITGADSTVTGISALVEIAVDNLPGGLPSDDTMGILTPTGDGYLTFDPADNTTFTPMALDLVTDAGGEDETTYAGAVTAEPTADWWWPAEDSPYFFGGYWSSDTKEGEFIAGERATNMRGSKRYLGEGYDTVAYLTIGNGSWKGSFYNDAMVSDTAIDGLRGFKASGRANGADFSTSNITAVDYTGKALGNTVTGSVQGSIFGPEAQVGGGIYELDIDESEEYADIYALYGATPVEDIEALAAGDVTLLYDGAGFNTDSMQMTVAFGSGTWEGEFYPGELYDSPINNTEGFAASGAIDGNLFRSDSLSTVDLSGGPTTETITGDVEGGFFGPDATAGHGEYDVTISDGAGTRKDVSGEFAMFQSEVEN
uniref:Uncharacterized protein n=1 Tax=Candidatus Kentrum sp. DK TaxID=2126562 RepID=A0A450SB68_9GAMM|nr:MAG: hypothetical protein BECKDK2373B_GA0170837_10242 [Candidatus Kentron sp. DK]